MYPAPTPLGCDSIDYHVLTDAVRLIKNVPGLTCEIGVRTGGSAKLIFDGLSEGRTHIGIDPYGGLPYKFDDGAEGIVDFTNERCRNPSLPKIYECAFSAGINFVFMNMTSAQFMSRFADGVPVYKNGYELLLNVYAMVFFDGLHTTDNVMAETMFFSRRATSGAVFVYDDHDAYDHERIDAYLRSQSWSMVDSTNRKISYKKA
jgi:hypothetical protein